MTSHIFASPLPDANIPDISITEFVLQQVSRVPARNAIIDGPSGKAYTFEQLRSRIHRLAGGLQTNGLKSGDVVGLIAPNSPEYAVVFHAIAVCGGTVTTINPTYGTEEISLQLKDSNACLLIADSSCLTVAAEASKGTACKELICLQANENLRCINQLMGEEIRQVAVDVRKHPVVLPYSSGTTGLPKGVMLSHYNLVANIVQINIAVKYGDHETGLAVLPFFHIYGMQVLMGSLLAAGATIVTMPRFDMEQTLQLIQEYRVTQYFAVPPIILGLAKTPLLEQYDISSLSKIFSGAAPLGGELAETASQRVGCPVVQAYGMTEISPVSHITPGFDGRPGSSGVTVSNTFSRIVDDNGQDLGTDEEGELWVKGPQVMLGYLNNEQATRETIDEDGWLHTGDVARIDADGYMSIVDRVKELIKYKGFQVAPAELEALIVTHPDVADVAVIGVPDEEAGELPKAFVVLKSTADEASPSITADDIREFVRPHVAKYKQIHEVEFIDSIPKSASGKILRRFLRNK